MTLAERLKQQGRRVGRQEGMQAGIQLGMQEGEEKMKNLIAQKLLSEGTEPAFVAKITGLSIEQVRQLKSDIDN